VSPWTIGLPRHRGDRAHMKLNALVRVAQILRSQPAYTMPLSRLHTCLAEELGTEAGTYAQMVHELKKRPHSFMVHESPRLLDHDDYASAIESMGLETGTRVSLAELGDDDAYSALSMACITLSELWARADADPLLREYLAQATSEMERLSETLP
jgi:hypothetical protein